MRNGGLHNYCAECKKTVTCMLNYIHVRIDFHRVFHRPVENEAQA